MIRIELVKSRVLLLYIMYPYVIYYISHRKVMRKKNNFKNMVQPSWNNMCARKWTGIFVNTIGLY